MTRDERRRFIRSFGRSCRNLHRETEKPMGWIWRSEKPAEELVEKIDAVMEPYRPTPAPDAAKKRDEWEEAVLARARHDKETREKIDNAFATLAASLKALGMMRDGVHGPSFFFQSGDMDRLERIYGRSEKYPNVHGFTIHIR
jgi:hypothetical protein